VSLPSLFLTVPGGIPRISSIQVVQDASCPLFLSTKYSTHPDVEATQSYLPQVAWCESYYSPSQLSIAHVNENTGRSRRSEKEQISVLLPLLRQHRSEQEAERLLLGQSFNEDDFIFSRVDGSPFNLNTVTHAFAKVAARAGLPHLRLHDLRHIHATMFLKAGLHRFDLLQAAWLVPLWSFTCSPS
jgi:hypothetical protein